MMAALIPYAGKDRPGPREGVYHGKDTSIVRLWQLGLDTADIAERVRLSEAAVYNRLAGARDRGRSA